MFSKEYMDAVSFLKMTQDDAEVTQLRKALVRQTITPVSGRRHMLGPKYDTDKFPADESTEFPRGRDSLLISRASLEDATPRVASRYCQTTTPTDLRQFARGDRRAKGNGG
ncbi:Protein of unknown function [Gryllus bimaculatus]|nr:Protein of unknown function [Gryllus bimaculatus]